MRPSGENATEVTLPECPEKVRSSLPLAMSHSFSVLSSLPERAVRPSGEKATDQTEPECPVKVRSSSPVPGAPEFQCLVRAAGKSSAPIREKATKLTQLSNTLIWMQGGVVVRSHCPVATSQYINVPSLLPERAMRPSGEKAIERIEPDEWWTKGPEGLAKVRSSLPVATSQSFSVSSLLPERAVRPSGEKATELTEPECPVKVAKLLAGVNVPEFQRLVTCYRKERCGHPGKRRPS